MAVKVLRANDSKSGCLIEHPLLFLPWAFYNDLSWLATAITKNVLLQVTACEID